MGKLINALIDKNKKKKGGISRKRKKLKKVKVRRLKRVRRKKNESKIAKTIKRLQQQKQIEDDMKALNVNKHRRNMTSKQLCDVAAASLRKGSMSIRKNTSLSIRNPTIRKQSVSVSKKSESNKAPNDKFESMMTGFHTMACNKVDALDKAFNNLLIFSGNVAVFFGEHDDLEWEELFNIFIGFFEHINKAKKANDALTKKREKERKKAERERLKKEKMAKRGLKPKKVETDGKNKEPVNILEEIKMKNEKGTLSPSKAKNDIVGYEKIQSNGRPKKKKRANREECQ